MLKRRILKRPFLTLALFIPACCLLSFICSGFTIELFPVQRLEAARTTWENNNIRNYRMVVHPSVEFDYIGNFQVTVREGKVVEAGTASSLNFDGTFNAIENIHEFVIGNYPKILPNKIADYTINHLYEIVADQIANLPPIHLTRCRLGRYHVEFDSELGYIRNFSFTSNNGFERGFDLWCSDFFAIGEYLTITDFEVLPD